MRSLFEGVPARAAWGLVCVIVLLYLAPVVFGGYVLSVLILCCYLAVLGQAWNVMMGFAGQLSLGHALYIGLGAYASGALFFHFGLGPWIGLIPAFIVAGAMGALIGWLGFRFGIRGVYFALLTIAFAEFVRILFDHWGWIGGSSGMFLPVQNRNIDMDLSSIANAFWTLRGPNWVFYYVILTGMVACLVIVRLLMRTRVGYYWLAIREDQEAAQAMGINVLRYKLLAVVISAMMTAFGGVFYAFYNNTLYPESIFSIDRSIELLLGVIIGGIGTLFGPILGAFALTWLGEGLSITQEWFDIDGLKLLTYGVAMLAIILFRPAGLWPWLRRLLGMEERRPDA